MSEEANQGLIFATITSMRREMNEGFSEVRRSLGKFGERVAKVEEWRDGHKKFHEGRGDNTGVVELQPGAAVAGRNGFNGFSTKKVKGYLMIGFFVAMGALVAWNTFSTPSAADMKEAASAVVEQRMEPVRRDQVKLDRMLSFLSELEVLLKEE